MPRVAEMCEGCGEVATTSESFLCDACEHFMGMAYEGDDLTDEQLNEMARYYGNLEEFDKELERDREKMMADADEEVDEFLEKHG